MLLLISKKIFRFERLIKNEHETFSIRFYTLLFSRYYFLM